jgi:hypothetical protein
MWYGHTPLCGVGAAGFFEVKKISPPAESLGIHELPSNTHNGDQISVRGEVCDVSEVQRRYAREHAHINCRALL